MDATSLLGGMLSSSFGQNDDRRHHHHHQESSGPGFGTLAAGAVGVAAVGGLGYLAYKHFAGQPGAQQMQPGMMQQGMQPGMMQQGMQPGMMQPGMQQGGAGGFLSNIAGSSTGLQHGNFSVPGYEYQTGGGGGQPQVAQQQWGQQPQQGQQQWGQQPAPQQGQPQQGQPQQWGQQPQAQQQQWPQQQAWGQQPGVPPQGVPQQGMPPQGVGQAPGGPSNLPTYTADQYRSMPDRPPSPYDDAPTYVPGSAPPPAAPPPAAPPAPVAPPAPAPAAAAPAAPFPAAPAPTPEQQKQALLLVRAMVAAASADGQIDGEERQAMLDRLSKAGAGQAERDALEAEMKAPQQVAVLAAEVNSPELAEQFYAVSLLGMKIDTDAEKAYAKMLPLILRLTPEQAAAIQQKIGVTVPG